jgi:hypothetical protein
LNSYMGFCLDVTATNVLKKSGFALAASAV